MLRDSEKLIKEAAFLRVEATSTALLLLQSNKRFKMETDSKERKQRNWNTFLTVFIAVTFTVALLEGVGLILFYSHFQSENTALENKILGLEERVLALGLDSTSTEGGKLGAGSDGGGGGYPLVKGEFWISLVHDGII